MKPFTFCMWLAVIALVAFLIYCGVNAVARRAIMPSPPPAAAEQISARSELIRVLGDLGAGAR